MSDVMMFGIAQMPYEMAMDDEISRRQFYANTQRLVAALEAAREEVRRLNFEVDAAAIYGDDRDAHYLQAEARAERLDAELHDCQAALLIADAKAERLEKALQRTAAHARLMRDDRQQELVCIPVDKWRALLREQENDDA